MILPGHLASVAIVSRLLRLDRPAALLASLYPDVLDKGLHWGTGLTPRDRLWGHTLWSILGTTVLAALWGRVAGRCLCARSWGLGYLVHLLGDVTSPVPLLYPLSQRGFHRGARVREMLDGQRRLPWRVFAAEALLALAALTLEWHTAHSSSKELQNCPSASRAGPET